MPCQLATFFEENFSSLALVFSQDKENGKKENTNLLNLFLYNSKIMMIIKNEKKKTMLAVVIRGGVIILIYIIMRTLVHIFIF